MPGLPVAFTSIHSDPLAPLGGISHGGQNVYVKELARHLTGEGFRVDVFSRWESPDQKPVEVIGPGARVVRVPVGPAGFVPKDELPALLPEVSNWIAEFWQGTNASYQLIHGHYYESGAVALALRKRWRVPVVETFHSLGIVKRLTLGPGDPSPVRRLEIERRIVQKADRIIATAPQERRDLLEHYGADPSQLDVIPCGVNLDLFRPVPKDEARRYIDIPEDRFLLTFVGRIEQRKGIDTLLRAISIVRARRPELPVHAIIVGGEQRGEAWESKPPEAETRESRRLEELASGLGIDSRVTFTGGMPQNVLRYYYSAGDVTVIPSYYEPFGMTALEALACGSSVIASRVGGLKSTVVEGQVGIQFEPQDAEDLAAKIVSLVEHPELNARFRREARPYVERNYSWTSVA
ncbi:MAG TPA: glycosyltransferase, partial [Ardenticatenaceae bacterium]|nr:glycosyltransferase [Ardenticatenaceae bacterium]